MNETMKLKKELTLPNDHDLACMIERDIVAHNVEVCWDDIAELKDAKRRYFCLIPISVIKPDDAVHAGEYKDLRILLLYFRILCSYQECHSILNNRKSQPI